MDLSGFGRRKNLSGLRLYNSQEVDRADPSLILGVLVGRERPIAGLVRQLVDAPLHFDRGAQGDNPTSYLGREALAERLEKLIKDCCIGFTAHSSIVL